MYLRAAIAIMLVLPAVAAGTADDPEITDPAGDVSFESAPVPAGFPIADASDVLAAWIALKDAQTVGFHIKVADLSEVERLGNDPEADFRWSLRFELPHANLTSDDYWSHTWNAHPTFSGIIYGGGWEFDIWDPREGSYVGMTGEVDIAAGVVSVYVPLADLAGAGPGDVFTKTSASAGHYWPAYPAWLGDWTAEGRDFVIPGQVETPAGPAPVAAPVPAPPPPTNDTAAPAPAKDSPAPAALLVIALALLARRRR